MVLQYGEVYGIMCETGEIPMNIGIVTISDHYNHGNRLQNYAMQYLLENDGHTVTTYGMFPRRVLGYVLPLALNLPFIPIFARMRRFKKFTAKHYHNVRIEFYSKKKLDGLNAKHDAFIAGSDQVWNPTYMHKPYAYFLQFADGYKRIAYAPSFGVTKFSPKWQERFKKALPEFESLSVRENEGAKFIKEWTGIDCPVVLDPTLLLTRDEWLKFSDCPRHMPKEKYMLTYFLMAKKEYKQETKRIAKQYGLKMVEISNFFGKYYTVNPSEFLYLMEHASIICTNSFHGHALSVALQKPFVSFSSVSHMTSRITTLLKLVGLENRNYKKINPEDYFELDYTKANKILAEKREKDLNYLKTALANTEAKAPK